MAKISGPQRLGPLTPFVGEWEGNIGVDLSYHNKDDETSETGYFERWAFHPIPKQENGKQELEGLKYENQAWRHGEESMDPFHDEIGYLLWEKTTGTIMRVVVFGRGIAMIAGGTAKARDRKLHFKATPGDPNFGILQNKYLSQRAELKGLEWNVSFNDDETFSYTQDLVLKLAAIGGKEMHHTDRNTLRCVKRYHPSVENT